MPIKFHEVVDCTNCKRMILDKDALWIESQIDKEIYPYCNEKCFEVHEAYRMGSMIDGAEYVLERDR
jgi:hypothetical protein